MVEFRDISTLTGNPLTRFSGGLGAHSYFIAFLEILSNIFHTTMKDATVVNIPQPFH